MADMLGIHHVAYVAGTKLTKIVFVGKRGFGIPDAFLYRQRLLDILKRRHKSMKFEIRAILFDTTKSARLKLKEDILYLSPVLESPDPAELIERNGVAASTGIPRSKQASQLFGPRA
jgi:hypothetical protein